MSQTRKKRPKRKTAARCKVARKRTPRARRASQYGLDPELDVAVARRKERTKHPGACRRRKRRRPRSPVAQPTPPPPSPPAAPGRLPSPVALYGGTFGRAQAERLLWRAGFGPSPGWPEALAAMGVDAAVESLISPAGAETFTGGEPRAGSTAGPLEPFDLFGHDHLFWLDRMVRSNQPFV